MSDWHHVTYILLALFVSTTAAWVLVTIRRRKAKLTLVAAEFGGNVLVKAGVSGFEVEFEREGAVFQGRISSGQYGARLSLIFYLPQFGGKFFIRKDSAIAGLRSIADEDQFSLTFRIPQLGNEFVFFSRDSDLPKKLLANKALTAEISALAEAFGYPQILFEDDRFQIFLQSSGWHLEEKFRAACHAAIVFQDCLIKLSSRRRS